MRRRARALACGVAGAGAIACALATVMPATTGCYTHQCDPSSFDYAPGSPGYLGKMLPDGTFETNGVDETWLNYPGNVTVNVRFPFDVGRAPVSIKGYVGVSDTPNSPAGVDFQPGNNWTETSGQLAQYFFLSSTGFSVNNNSCAAYFARFVVTFAPETLLLFGGFDGQNAQFDTWAWDGRSWAFQTPSVWPTPVRQGAVMGSLNGKIMLFGGSSDGVHPVASGGPDTPFGRVTGTDTWTWDGVNWTQASVPPPLSDGAPAPLPSERFDAASGVALALDPFGHYIPQIVMFGGRGVKADGTPVDLDDTWAWNGFVWTPQSSATKPSARSGAAAASLQGGLVVFGGSSNGALQNDTWVWNKGWSQAQSNPTSGAAPTARAHAAAASYGGNVVLFGGNDGMMDLGDTWLWNGSSWSQPMLAGPTPSPRSSAAMGVFGGVAVLFGGTSGTKPLGDTWTWDGHTWTEQNVQGPSARSAVAMAAN